MKYFEIEVRKAGHDGPLALYHPHWTRAAAPLLDELGAVLDHVTAFVSDGLCIDTNLVTACAKCNGRKSAATVEKWDQREKRRPIKGKYGEPSNWDGLSNLFVVLAGHHSAVLTAGERDWLKAIRSNHTKSA